MQHFVPLLSLTGLANHAALHDVMAKIKVANAKLEDEKSGMEEVMGCL